MKGLVYVSAAVLLLVAWDGLGVRGELMDYMISFRAEAPSSTLVSVKELPDGNFALVTTSKDRSICEYRRYDRNTQVLSKARLLEGGCENVAWGEDGSFVTKGFPCNYGLPCPRAYSFQREFPNKGDLTDFIADYVRKYDSSGLFLWRAPFVLHEDEYHEGSLAVLSDGSVVADNDYPVKYSPSGKVLWENQDAVPKNYGKYRGGGIVEVENRNVLVTTNDYYNSVALHKIAPRGRKVWTKVMRIGCPADTYLSPVLSTDGSYYAGCTTGFGDSTVGKIAQGDYRVYKVSPTSKLLWVKTVKASGNEHLHTILPEDDGGVLLIGTSDSGKGQDKMAERRGPWSVKLDARGRVEWDFVGEGLITAKSRHGYLFRARNPLMFAELVINQPRTSKELLSGNVIAIKSEENNRYIRTSSRIYANGKSVTPSSQWMVLRDKTEDSAFALRSVQSGKVASLVEVRPSDVLLKATTSSLRPRSKRDRFNIRHLGRGSDALLSDYEKYGYLRPNLKNGRIVATPSKQSDRKMRITRLHSGHPLIGSEVVLRLSSKNVLLEATAAGTVRARTKGLPLDGNRFVFKVATIPAHRYPRDFIQLKSKATGKWLTVGNSQRVEATGEKSSMGTMFYPIISREGYIRLALPNSGKCLRHVKNGVYANGSLKNSDCDILFATLNH